MATLSEIAQRIMDQIKFFKTKEQREWGAEGTVIELTKQVGDLAKRIMVYEKYYFKSRETNPYFATNKEDIGDELSDIITCCVRLADHYNIDLESSINKSIENADSILQGVK